MFGAIGAFFAGLSSSQLFVVGVILQLGASMILTRKPDQPKTPGQKVNTRSTQEAVPIVYGTQKIAGNDVYIENSGSDNTYLWIIQTLSEGECDSVESVWYNEKEYGEDSGVTDKADYWFYPGSSTQAAAGNVPGDWDDPLRHTCYMVHKLKWSPKVFNGLPKRAVVLKGRKLYDFRDGTTAWSDNPVLCLYDYMTNARYGLGCDATEFDTESWSDLADYCDEGRAQGSPRWTYNRVFDQQESAQDIIDDICQHFRGQLIWFAGVFSLRKTEWENTVFDIADQHIVQGNDGVAGISVEQPSAWGTAQGMRVKYYTPSNNWVLDDVTLGDHLGAIDTLELLGCTEKRQAAALGIYTLERQMLNRGLSFTGRDDLLQLEPHDMVTFTSAALSIEDQPMRVTSATIQPDGLVQVGLQWESSDLYNTDFDITADDIYNCTLPAPSADVPIVYGVSVAEETYTHSLRTMTRLLVDFTIDPDYIWFKHVEVEVSVNGGAFEFYTNAKTDFMIDPVQESSTYTVRLTTINIFNARSEDTASVTANITGSAGDTPTSLTELHAILNGRALSLYSERVDDPEIEVYEFRMGSSWTNAVFLASVRSPNYSLSGLKPGVHTFWCNTYTTTGQYGATPVSATVTVPSIGLAPDHSMADDFGFTRVIDDNFTNSLNSWTPGSGTLTQGATYVTFNPTSGGIVSGAITKSGLSFSGDDARYVGIRVKQVAGDSFYGSFRWKRSGDGGWSSSRSVSLHLGNDPHYPEPDGWATAWVDVVDLNSNWAGETITDIRFVLAMSGDDTFQIDWVVVSPDYAVKRTQYATDWVLQEVEGAWLRGEGVNPSGNYLSRVLDINSNKVCTAWIDTELSVIGAGTQWGDRLPTPMVWASVDPSKRWRDIFEYQGAPSVNVTVYSGDTNPPTAQATGQAELLTCTQTGRYWQVGVEITDPDLLTKAQMREYTLNLYEE